MVHLKLFELLQSGTASSAASKMITFAQNNDADELHRVILQLFVNFVERSYLLTTEDLKNDTSDTVMAVYESERFENKLETISSVKDFFTSFVDRGYQMGIADKFQQMEWVEFVLGLATHEEIPENCAFKVQAMQLLSLLLNPLAKNTKEPGRRDNELVMALEDSIQVFSNGFAFVSESSGIAEEFVEAMETCPEIFINENVDYLELYKKLMLKESSVLHIIALKSLRKLCNNQDLHSLLEDFFFEEPDDSDESFRNIFAELLSRKNLKMFTMPLVKAIKNLPSERNILSDDSRDTIYLHIFDLNRKVVAETVELMIGLGENVWLQAARLLNTSEQAQVDLNVFLQNLSNCEDVNSSAAHLLNLLCENLDDHQISQRLASILVAQMRLNSTEHITVLKTLDQLLDRCSVDEMTFTLLLELIDVFSTEQMIEYYKLNVAQFTSLTTCLTTAFVKFNSIVTLHNIINSLGNLTKMSPGHVLGEMRTLFNTFYSEFLTIYERCQSGDQDLKDIAQPITKLSNILEFRGWNILSESNYKTLGAILDNILQACGADDSTSDVYLITCRFYTNFIKQIWVRCILDKPFSLKLKAFRNEITSFEEGSFDILKGQSEQSENNESKKLNEGFYVIRSLLDILVMFQPTMKDLYAHKMFKRLSLVLTKEKVKMLGAYVAKAVYGQEKSADKEEIHKREMILLSWISFCKNYTNLPSLTASEKIVANFRADDPFKSHMEMMLEHLLTQKSSFEQTVSIVVYHFTNSNDAAGFRAFFQLLDDFIFRSVKEADKRSNIKLGIGIAVLNKLAGHIVNLRGRNDDNRLDVLELVKIVIKALDPKMKAKLIAAVPKELDTIGLSDDEKESLDAFKGSLHG